ncbi:hypothetical protein D9758_016487 [Tetrapyrgos nigripes]|uniref:Uncharacterized protein n=1 Tax=Tetrapyrgos nigripes TaxID=182062 RepID=A0A8H5CMH9_9AGAR|nr:hypothetical protein D9758_016487 [Tetrapyrgos nigripes]
MTRDNLHPSLLDAMSSSLRNHRVIIASLFLPNTVVLGPDEPEYYSYQSPQPQKRSPEITVPDVVLRLQKDKAKPVLTSQISSAHPHLPSSALGTPSSPSVPTVANAPGTGVIPTLTSTMAGTPPTVTPGTTNAVKSIVQDLKDRATARKSGALSANVPLTTAPLSPGATTAEIANPFSKPGSVSGSGAASGAVTPGLAKQAVTHGHHGHGGAHRSPLSRVGSSVAIPKRDASAAHPAPVSASDIPVPPIPVTRHRTLSRRTFRRQSSTALSSSYTSGSGRSKSKRRTPGAGSTASISSIMSASSTASISGAEALDTPSYPSPSPSGDDISTMSDSATFYDEDEGHADEEDEDEFHIEPNSHCNAGLKNAVDSVSPWSSAPDANFVRTTSPTSTSPVATSPGAGPGTPSVGQTHKPSRTRTGSRTSFSNPNAFSTDLRDRPLRQKLWVGTLGTRTDDWRPELRGKVEDKLSKEFENEVVWVEDGVFEGAYDEFCHQVLWPTLHYTVPDAPKTKLLVYSSPTSKAYKDYVEVNRKVAEKIKEIYREGDVVWVNDYHLMLVPRMLRALGIAGAVGFFLHVSFPSSEILRCLPVRIPLLRGILGADLVGFQTANLARHFRQTCGRVLGVEALPRGVVVGDEADDEDAYDAFEKLKAGKKTESSSESDSDDATDPRKKKDPYYAPLTLTGDNASASGLTRFVNVGVFPMGIDVGRLKERRKSPEVEEWVEVLKSRYKSGKNQKVKLVVGRDKLDDVQGVKQKVQAFELFLEKHPEWVGKVVLIQIALPSPPPPTSPSEGGHSKPAHSAAAHFSSLSNDSSASTAASTDITSTILSKVAQINSKWSSLTYQPIVFLHTAEVDWNQYLALLSVADAFLVTSLREGMALRTHEFVVVQEGRGKDNSNGKPKGTDTDTNAEADPDAALSDQEGTLILSEFTGSYSYSGFRSCIAINPWDTRGTADAIAKALMMDKEEAKSRWEELSEHVETQTAQAFVRGFLGRCVRAAAENRGLGAYKKRKHATRRNVGEDGDELEEEDDDDERTEVEEVDTRKVKLKWKHANKRLVFVDWEGTLVGDWLPIPKELQLQRELGLSRVISREDEDAENPQNEDMKEKVLKELSEKEKRKEEEFQRAIEVLKKLAADPKKNEVWVLSGLPVKGVLEKVEKELGGNIGIVAENGCFIKTRAAPTSTRSGAERQQQQQGSPWLNMVANLNMTWKSSCLEILNYFTERTPGSFVEERAASVVWRFWTGPTDDIADRQWARRQAAEAQNHIFDRQSSSIYSNLPFYSLGERYGLRIIPGTNSFLVLPNNISRSSAVGAILHPGGPAHSPLVGRSAWMVSETDSVPMVPEEWDFVLAVSGDEKLLRRLGELDQCETMTISTSGKGSDAKWRMSSGRAGEVLGELANA